MIAFRRTERNDAMPRDMMTTIAARQDRSSVYASDGNPLHFMRTMERDGQLHGEGVADLVSLDTPWLFRRADRYIGHDQRMWPATRADDGARRRTAALKPPLRNRKRKLPRRVDSTSRRASVTVRSPQSSVPRRPGR
ncbi:hypothetical protein LGN10_01355 [Burkholderia sp. AU32262]|nr:hypothetical protein [Burkholderia arboris]MCA8239362.1 hypothetical protein [Burkholderia sp. AU32262]